MKRKIRKPITKRWWFWVVSVVILSIAIGACSGNADNNESDTTSKPEISDATLGTSSNDSAEDESIPNDTLTLGQKNALDKAYSYLDFKAFSYTGLIDQLEFEGFTTEEATFAVDNCGADWNEQALLSAINYLDLMAFSYTGLIDQLEFEGFTTEQATYGADNCNADWNEQAAKKAQDYLDFMSFSKEGLLEQLEYEGFTHEQALYGASKAGY